jgi:hypothetical protein
MTKIHRDGARILFLVDHKHRDLPGLSLIGYFLKQMEYQVKYVSLWQVSALIYLVPDVSSYATGQNIIVNGGLVAWLGGSLNIRQELTL